MAGFMFDLEQGINQGKGEWGEFHVAHHLRRDLPDSWVIFHNAIIEPRPDVFAQIDILLIGPPGLFLIEAKAWRGSYTAYRDEWKRREGRHWVECSSPTKQVSRHVALIKPWLHQCLSVNDHEWARQYVVPLVVFTQAQWLRTTACSAPVFDGVKPLLQHLRAQPLQVLNMAQIEEVAHLIARAPVPVPRIEQAVVTERSAPLCPRCAIPLLPRTSKHGRYQGEPFWGCRNYPACREIIRRAS
jgi:hypothetical protein